MGLTREKSKRIRRCLLYHCVGFTAVTVYVDSARHKDSQRTRAVLHSDGSKNGTSCWMRFESLAASIYGQLHCAVRRSLGSAATAAIPAHRWPPERVHQSVCCAADVPADVTGELRHFTGMAACWRAVHGSVAFTRAYI